MDLTHAPNTPRDTDWNPYSQTSSPCFHCLSEWQPHLLTYSLCQNPGHPLRVPSLSISNQTWRSAGISYVHLLCNTALGWASFAPCLDCHNSLQVSLLPDFTFAVKCYFFLKNPIISLTCITLFRGSLRMRIWLGLIITMCYLLLSCPLRLTSCAGDILSASRSSLHLHSIAESFVSMECLLLGIYLTHSRSFNSDTSSKPSLPPADWRRCPHHAPTPLHPWPQDIHHHPVFLSTCLPVGLHSIVPDHEQPKVRGSLLCTIMFWYLVQLYVPINAVEWN